MPIPVEFECGEHAEHMRKSQPAIVLTRHDAHDLVSHASIGRLGRGDRGGCRARRRGGCRGGRRSGPAGFSTEHGLVLVVVSVVVAGRGVVRVGIGEVLQGGYHGGIGRRRAARRVHGPHACCQVMGCPVFHMIVVATTTSRRSSPKRWCLGTASASSTLGRHVVQAALQCITVGSLQHRTEETANRPNTTTAISGSNPRNACSRCSSVFSRATSPRSCQRCTREGMGSVLFHNNPKADGRKNDHGSSNSRQTGP